MKLIAWIFNKGPFLIIFAFHGIIFGNEVEGPGVQFDANKFAHTPQHFFKLGIGIATPPEEIDTPSYSSGGYDVFAELSPGFNILRLFKVKNSISLQPYFRGIYKGYSSSSGYAASLNQKSASGGLTLLLAQSLYFQYGYTYSEYKGSITTAPGTLYSVNFPRSSDGIGSMINIGYNWFFARKSNIEKPVMSFIEVSIISEEHTTDSYLKTSGESSTKIKMGVLDFNFGVGLTF